MAEVAEQKRKGSRSIKDIPSAILTQLNSGQLETANLIEWLAIDQKLLLENLLKSLGREAYIQPILAGIGRLKKQTVNTVNAAIGESILVLATTQQDAELLSHIAKHSSDMVRCWAVYAVGRNPQLNISQMLRQIQPFAADKHFGVREVSWLAVRPSIASNLSESIAILAQWTSHFDENIRRFASEATRPRGVWCEHIETLKQNPALALSILEPLKADAAKYVQDSVANWLNDASKTQPDFVMDLCEEWRSESNTKETAYIIKKALRSIAPTTI